MTDLTGKSLGPYEIISRIGAGGMATVYKAYHAVTDRHVAIKVLSSELAGDAAFTERFEREAKTVAGLQHVHILPVFDYGTQDDFAYLVMPLITAGTLSERIETGEMSYSEIARVLEQLGGAIDYAHRRGLIHRDIKPDNVLVDDSDNVLLTDFGIARMALNSSKANLTATGTFLGTPSYVSPEQAQGMEIDGRSDVYSLGVVLYEMLIGSVPFDGETPIAVALKHVSEDLPSLSDINPKIPPEVEAVVQKALNKLRDYRYNTASELAADFARAISLHDKHAATQENLQRPASDTPILSKNVNAPKEDAQYGVATTVAPAVEPAVPISQQVTAASRGAGSATEATPTVDTTAAAGPNRTENALAATVTVQLIAAVIGYFALPGILLNAVQTAVGTGQVADAERPIQLLSAVAPAELETLGNDLNDAAVDFMASQPPEFAQARTHLEVVRLIDDALPAARSAELRSISRYNLGLIYEFDDSLQDGVPQATDAYRQAIRIDDSNIEARFARSSLLLIEDTDLDEAVRLAERGWKNYLDTQSPPVCSGEQDLTDEATFFASWHCFMLITTEAAARYERGDEAAGDTPGQIEQLLQRATSLAEANDQFRERDGFYTAQAYYYLARVTEPNTPEATLCHIINTRDPRSARHQVWFEYANQQLDGAFCLPS